MVRSVLDDRWKVPKSFKVVRHGTLVAYDDLDDFLRSRERPRPRARTVDSGAGAASPGRALPPADDRRRAPAARNGSPFDFSDFDPGAGEARQPLKNVKIG